MYKIDTIVKCFYFNLIRNNKELNKMKLKILHVIIKI